MTEPLFLGTFRYAQDLKGRILIPSEWRDQLGESVIFTWDGTRLVMRGKADFQRFHRDDFTLLPSLLCARSWEAPVKALGRILIPHGCRQLAGLLNVSDLGWAGLGDCAWLGTWAQVERFVVGPQREAGGGMTPARLTEIATLLALQRHRHRVLSATEAVGAELLAENTYLRTRLKDPDLAHATLDEAGVPRETVTGPWPLERRVRCLWAWWQESQTVAELNPELLTERERLKVTLAACGLILNVLLLDFDRPEAGYSSDFKRQVTDTMDAVMADLKLPAAEGEGG